MSTVDKKLIAEVVIENYPRRIIKSKKRNAKYFKKGDSIPKNKLNKIGTDYEWQDFIATVKGVRQSVKYLVEIDSQKRVIKNTRTAGTPSYLIINGQKLHQLTLKDYDRSTIITKLKEVMCMAVANLEPIKVRPLIIEGELHDTYYDQLVTRGNKVVTDSSADWDIDNRELFYNKTFQDVLTGCKSKNPRTGKIEPTSKVIIPDDHRGYITQPPHLMFVPIAKNKTPKIIYRIYQDLRPIILSSPHYTEIEGILERF